MSSPALRILIPTLIAEPGDVRRLSATLAGLPPGLDAVAHPLVQSERPDVALPDWPAPAAARPADDGSADAGRARAGPAGAGPAGAGAADAEEDCWARERAALAAFVRPDHPPCPVQPLPLGAPAGKWGALRTGLARCGPADWIAVLDGDDAYDPQVLPALLWRAQAGEGALFQGERERIVLDETEDGRRRALLEPVVNELLRARAAARGAPLAPEVWDLQSGLFVVQRSLLEAFLAQERMDGADAARAPGPLPWGAYGGELHLHAYAAARGARVRAHPVRSRSGRASGWTPAAVGRHLRGSVLFAAVAAAEVDAAVAAAAARGGWDAAARARARGAAAEAFPEAG